MSQRTIQAAATQPIRALLQGEQEVAVKELLRSLETRINIYIEECWNKILDLAVLVLCVVYFALPVYTDNTVYAVLMLFGCLETIESAKHHHES